MSRDDTSTPSLPRTERQDHYAARGTPEMTARESAVQQLLDRAAYFNLRAGPDPERPNVVLPMPDGSGRTAGVLVRGIGRRFDITVQTPTERRGLRASNVVGQRQLDFRFRWLIIPEDFGVAPGREPQPTPLDPTRSQRFGILDGEFRFGPNGRSQFRSIGAGRTFPALGDRQSIRLAGIGNVMDASGQLQQHQGVYVLSGSYTPPAEFRLNIFIRFNDLQGDLEAEAPLPPLEPVAESIPGTTYLYVRTYSDPSQAQLIPGPGGIPAGLIAAEAISMFHTDSSDQGQMGLRCRTTIGPIIGSHSVKTYFFPSQATPGTAISPIPFSDQEQFHFTDARGDAIGSITANVIEGRSIITELPGTAPDLGPQVFGGFALAEKGTGEFAGCKGIVTNVGIGTVDPHLTSIIYIFDLLDLGGRFRATPGALR
jgi:hypothetical protein